MSEEVVIRRDADGKTVLVGESDYVTYKAAALERNGVSVVAQPVT